MRKWNLDDRRKVVGWTLLGLGAAAAFYFFSPGIPILWGPWAFAGEKARGQELFNHTWMPNDSLAGGDGLGPVFNAKSCVACHFQGGVGGAGGDKGDVKMYHVRKTNNNEEAHGLVHFASTAKQFQESAEMVRKLFPLIKGSTSTRRDGHCSYTVTIPDFDPVKFETVHATPLFGVGWIDLVSDKAIRYHQTTQTIDGTWTELMDQKFEIKPQGKVRVLADGRVGKFGWKAQFATLEEFVAAACANELGLSTPIHDQPTPLAQKNYKSTGMDMSKRQLADLTAYVSTLPRPVEVESDQSFDADRGKQVFMSVGCAVCHVPNLGGVKGLYSDLLLHDITSNFEADGGGGMGSSGSYDPPEPPGLPPSDSKEPGSNEWKTPPLWGVADSAPYFHDGKAPTLDAAITRHRGDATMIRKAYRKLPKSDQDALITFLRTLRAPPTAEVATPPVVSKK